MTAAFRYLAILLLCLCASFALAEGHPHPRPPRSLLDLALVPEVQQELKLDESRVEQLRAARVAFRERAINERASLMDYSPEERGKRFMAFAMDQEHRIAEILDHHQMWRLKQLDLQSWGIRALIRQDVQDRLNLTAEQRGQIKTILDNERSSVHLIFGDFHGGRDLTPEQRAELKRKMDAMRDVRSQAERNLSAVLTDSQRKHFSRMQGAPFKFPDFHARPPGGV